MLENITVDTTKIELVKDGCEEVYSKINELLTTINENGMCTGDIIKGLEEVSKLCITEVYGIEIFANEKELEESEKDKADYDDLYSIFDIKAFSDELLRIINKEITLTTPREFYNNFGDAFNNKNFKDMPREKFLMLEGNTWTVIDNSTYEGFADGFDNVLDAIEYLIHDTIENYKLS